MISAVGRLLALAGLSVPLVGRFMPVFVAFVS